MSFLPHPALIPHLPGTLLRALHRDVCSLRGRRWGCPCPGAPYLRYSSWQQLLGYHAQILQEFKVRGYRFQAAWTSPHYRGRKVPPWAQDDFTPSLLVAPFDAHTPEYYTRSRERAVKRLQRGNWLPEDTLRLYASPRCI